MILSNDGLVAFHYRSYGTFFLQQNRLHNIHRDLPTTNIIEPEKRHSHMSWRFFYAHISSQIIGKF